MLLMDQKHSTLIEPRAGLGLVAGALLLVTLVSGCGGSDGLPDMVPVSGQVLYNGKPLTDGQVVYLPKTPGAGRQANGAIQPDGTFEMMTLRKGDGVMQGEYVIAIYAYKPHPGEPKTREEHEAMARRGGIKREYSIPERYANAETSGLADKVDDSHSGEKKIELSD